MAKAFVLFFFLKLEYVTGIILDLCLLMHSLDDLCFVDALLLLASYFLIVWGNQRMQNIV